MDLVILLLSGAVVGGTNSIRSRPVIRPWMSSAHVFFRTARVVKIHRPTIEISGVKILVPEEECEDGVD